MHWTECGIRTICPQVRVGALATGGFLECFEVEHSTKPERIHVVIYYFLAIIVALIIVFVLIERDAF